jgi:Sec-independent protein translocase protein TatA
MAAPNRLPLMTLGWQTWAILAVVLLLLIGAAATLMLG